MYMNFNTFTRYFFYLFLCYQYANYYYPEKTQKYLIFIGYKLLYLYSKLQILLNKKKIECHNLLIKYENYQKLLLCLDEMKNNISIVREFLLEYTLISPMQSNITTNQRENKILIDVVANNEILFTFKKSEFLREYLNDFLPNDKSNSVINKKNKQPEKHDKNEADKTDESNETDETNDEIFQDDNIGNYDFIIINGDDNLKKITKRNDLKVDTSTFFEFEPFLYKPLLCEFINGIDNDNNKPIKIDFSDNNKSYDFLVIGNCFDKKFLTYFMKKYYGLCVKDNYVLKILDNNVNTLLIESSNILKIDKNSLVVL